MSTPCPFSRLFGRTINIRWQPSSSSNIINTLRKHLSQHPNASIALQTTKPHPQRAFCPKSNLPIPLQSALSLSSAVASSSSSSSSSPSSSSSSSKLSSRFQHTHNRSFWSSPFHRKDAPQSNTEKAPVGEEKQTIEHPSSAREIPFTENVATASKRHSETETEAEREARLHFERQKRQLRLDLMEDDTTSSAVLLALGGNLSICTAKAVAFYFSGSAAMFAELVHTFADSVNQLILYFGVRQSHKPADAKHQYGYGRAAFLSSLISAVGTFWLGGVLSVYHGIHTIINPPEALEIGLSTWGVLAFSFIVDSFVLQKVMRKLFSHKPKDMSSWKFMKGIQDPSLMSVLLEDFAATSGVLIAVAGIGLSQLTGLAIYDGFASIGIGALLGGVAFYLLRLNHKFLIGQAVDESILIDIKELLAKRPSIEGVYGVKSVWVGPQSFSFKAEIDFSGEHFASQLSEPVKKAFLQAKQSADIDFLLSRVCEDTTKMMEIEIIEIEKCIRQRFPECQFIELEPSSIDKSQFETRWAQQQSKNDQNEVSEWTWPLDFGVGEGEVVQKRRSTSAYDSDSDDEDDDDINSKKFN